MTAILLPLAIVFALVLLATLARTKWKHVAAWTALALVGQAAALQMIDAGRLIHFQHYRSLAETASRNALVPVIIGLQVALVAFGIRKRLPVIWTWLRERLQLWQVLSLGVLLLLAGAAVTSDFAVYSTSLLTSAFVQFVSLGNIVLAAWAVPADSIAWLRRKTDQLLGGSDLATGARLDRFSLLAAAWIVLVSAALSYFVYQNHPHVPDETQYLFQAKYFAAGQLTVSPPRVPEAFTMYMVPHAEARWFSIFSPGWPALLAVGTKLHAAWLVNPLLAGLCVLLAYLFFQQIYSRRLARLGVLLLCCSPWFVFMAMSFMSHVFTLAGALAAAVLLYKAKNVEKPIYAVSAGLAIGVLSLIRPLDGLIIAGLLGLWTLFKCPTWRSRLLTGTALVLGTTATGALVLPYNRAITGSALLSPLSAYYAEYYSPKVMALGFGADRGIHWGLDAFPGHSPLEAAVNAALNTYLVNTELFGWGTGSLVLAGLFMFAFRIEKKDAWAFAVIAAVIGGYSLTWYHGGPDFGARYWFLCIIPLVALTARGAEWVASSIEETGPTGRHASPRVVLAVGVLCGLTLLNFVPWRALDKYYGYRGMRPEVRELARKQGFGRSLVLVRGEEHPDYQSAWIYNPLNFEGNAPLYARATEVQTRERLFAAYPDRPVWIIDGPTRTGGSYAVVQGPIETGQVRKGFTVEALQSR